MEELQRTLGRRRRAAMEEQEKDKEQGKDLEKKQEKEVLSKTLSRTGSFSQGPGSPGPSPFSRTKSFHSGQKVTRVSPWRGKEEQEDRRKEQEEKEGKKREQELAKLKEEIVAEMRDEVRRAKDEILEVLRSLLSPQQ